MTERERKQVEHMMRVAVAAQGLIDTLLAQGDLLLNPPDETNDAPSAPKAAQRTVGVHTDDDPNDPPRLGRPRAKVPKSLEG